jgi:hypothetical protein
MQVLQYVQNVMLALQFGVVVLEADETEANIPIIINTSYTPQILSISVFQGYNKDFDLNISSHTIKNFSA